MGNENSNAFNGYELSFSGPSQNPHQMPENYKIYINPAIKTLISQISQECNIIWHDPSIFDNANNSIVKFFMEVCTVYPFDLWQEASSHIKSSSVPCFLISSGRDGEILVNEIGKSPQLLSVYIYCENVELHSKWAKKNKKVALVTNKDEELEAVLIRDVIRWKRETFRSKIESPSLYTSLDQKRQGSQLLSNRLKDLMMIHDNRDEAKRDFLHLAKASCKDIQYMETFEAEYQPEQVFRWYRKEEFIYSLVDSCLRIKTYESIMYSRLIINDLQKMIFMWNKKNNEGYTVSNMAFSGQLYQEVYMKKDEWKAYRGNIGQDIVLTNFFQAEMTKKPGGNPVCNVEITIIVPMDVDQGEQGFVFMGEDKFLFNIFSRFTILEASTEVEKGIERHSLVLFYGAQALRKDLRAKSPKCKVELDSKIICQFCGTSAGEIYANLLGKPVQCTCQSCLNKGFLQDNSPLVMIPQGKKDFLEVNGTVMIYRQPLDVPFYGYRCSECKKNLERCYRCTDCQGPSKVWCELCVKQKEECKEREHGIVYEKSPYSFWSEKVAPQDLCLLEYPNKLMENTKSYEEAEEAVKRKEYEKAVGLYEKVFEENKGRLDELVKGEINKKIGNIYFKLNKNDKGEQYYEEAFLIMNSIYGEGSQVIGEMYGALGEMKERIGDLHSAASYYKKAQEIFEKNCGKESEEAERLRRVRSEIEKSDAYRSKVL